MFRYYLPIIWYNSVKSTRFGLIKHLNQYKNTERQLTKYFLQKR